MKIGDEVEYHTGNGEYATGTISSINHEAETVTVLDINDGARYIGPFDFVYSTEYN
jgi:ribosomal protein L24